MGVLSSTQAGLTGRETTSSRGSQKPNMSYHGVVFTEISGKLAYIVKLRNTLMRDQGAVISPFNSFLLLVL